MAKLQRRDSPRGPLVLLDPGRHDMKVIRAVENVGDAGSYFRVTFADTVEELGLATRNVSFSESSEDFATAFLKGCGFDDDELEKIWKAGRELYEHDFLGAVMPVIIRRRVQDNIKSNQIVAINPDAMPERVEQAKRTSDQLQATAASILREMASVTTVDD